jgi:translation initiation factor IF-2
MRVAEGEAGGITQEVRAYKVITPRGPVVFLGEIQNICAKVGGEIARDCFV